MGVDSYVPVAERSLLLFDCGDSFRFLLGFTIAAFNRRSGDEKKLVRGSVRPTARRVKMYLLLHRSLGFGCRHKPDVAYDIPNL